MIDRAASGDEKVRLRLAKHPRVVEVFDDGRPGIRWSQGDWARELRVGDAGISPRGLVELMDNNPLVCADVASVPSAGATAALIALGPLVSAGLLAEAPIMVTNFPADDSDVGSFLETEGWLGGLSIHHERFDLSGVGVATVMAAIRTPNDLDDVDALFEERFGHCFFIRRDEESDWGPELVEGSPTAHYRLLIAEAYPLSLLTIRILASLDGKYGSGQLIHAMNVMAGFEESLGLAG